MFLFINFFYCYRKSISIFDCYQIAILNILITDINYYFIDWLHLVLNFLYFNYLSQLCWYNWHQCHWGGRIKTNIFWSFLSNKTKKWEQPICCWCQGCSCPSTMMPLKIIKNLMACESYINLFKKHFRRFRLFLLKSN